MTFELRRTGKRVLFDRVPFGNPFFAHGKMWVRISGTGATHMASSDYHASCCSFDIDSCDQHVEYVVYIVDGVPQISDERIARMDDLKPEDFPPADYEEA